jgi:hypothetical protein
MPLSPRQDQVIIWATITCAEHAAAARGATVSVVSQDPADETLATLLTRAGYRRTAD